MKCNKWIQLRRHLMEGRRNWRYTSSGTNWWEFTIRVLIRTSGSMDLKAQVANSAKFTIASASIRGRTYASSAHFKRLSNSHFRSIERTPWLNFKSIESWPHESWLFPSIHLRFLFSLSESWVRVRRMRAINSIKKERCHSLSRSYNAQNQCERSQNLTCMSSRIPTNSV